MSIKNRIARHPLGWYFGINIGWICTYAALAYRSIPPEMPDGLASIPPLLLLLVMVGMPSVFGIALTGVLEGKAGVKALFSRLLIGRVGARWYAAAVLVPTLLTGIAYLLQAWMGGPEPVIRWEMLAVGLGSGLFSGPFEELGWRGFALPRLLKRFAPHTAALLLGLGWGTWHLALNFIGLRQHGSLMIPIAVISGPILLTGFTVLMTWVYTHARGSLLMMVLFHIAITTNALFFSLNAPSAADALRLALATAAVVWLAAGPVLALSLSKSKTAELVLEPSR